MADTVDVIVRFHDPRRVMELSRAIFSLYGQSYRPIKVLLMLQQFEANEVANVSRELHDFATDDASFKIEIHNCTNSEPGDAQARLVNEGLSFSQGRYLGFLNYGDTLYPEAYRLLVGQLATGKAGIAFAGIRRVQAIAYGDFVYVGGVLPRRGGASLRDLLTDNSFPIHCALIDRDRVPPALLQVDTQVATGAVQAMMSRLLGDVPASLVLLGMIVGDQMVKPEAQATG